MALSAGYALCVIVEAISSSSRAVHRQIANTPVVETLTERHSNLEPNDLLKTGRGVSLLWVWISAIVRLSAYLRRGGKSLSAP